MKQDLRHRLERLEKPESSEVVKQISDLMDRLSEEAAGGLREVRESDTDLAWLLENTDAP